MKKDGIEVMKRGEFLLKVIEEEGYNVMSLSKASGVPYTTIRSMIERDLSNASIDNVLKICSVLGITAESLASPDIEHGTIATDRHVEKRKEDELEETKMSPAEIAEFEAFINNPEHGLFFKDYLEAPEERKKDLQKVWEIIKRASESDEK
ncbi:helix-turn-helix domain-containing protein [Paenibacillus lutimineralis]|uniref:XRE family transcriptional regulator n=1 Tax=Paenibacillus lutimineralis TaxID=2707005 RepID=A0A3Q9IBW5_9BACL|nr:helix-turn-helix transcriptional regulator [Paenibacillus lutimineralis]AZS17415.1 XRE family transcriptional regulator [Paenibacillus lutimineralis]